MAFPGESWETASPASQSLDSNKLAAAVEYLQKNSGRDGVHELAVVRNGRLVWQGDKIDKVHGVWSCTKSFTSTILGLLIDDGKCTLETPARQFAPELAQHYGEVRLKHFATMTSGYRAAGDEPQGGYKHGPSNTPFRPSDKPLFTPPGSQYAYWDSAMNMFGLVLTRAAGEPLESLFKRRIADPIGMNPRAWDWGDYATIDGLVVNGGSGNGGKHITISAREMARLGHLFLNRGDWNGRRLLSAEWVDQATSTQVPAATPWAHPESDIDGRGVYGLNWWTNGMKPDGLPKWPAVPAGAFAASGHNNNRMFVLPEWGMVIVRLGLDEADGKISDAVWSEFLRLIGEARMDSDARPAGDAPPAGLDVVQPRGENGDGSVEIGGELKQWHKVTLTWDGPFAHERDNNPNPFTDIQLAVTFRHESGSPEYLVPMYFAADGNAANSGAESGTKWRAHLSPDKLGTWTYRLSRLPRLGLEANDKDLEQSAPAVGQSGSFTVAPSDKTGRDFRAKGRLRYVGGHYLQHAASGEFFLKAGPDAPETLLAYADFDGVEPGRRRNARPGEAAPTHALHRYGPHVRDWRDGDPAWRDGKGKGLIGALNYLASKGCNSISFLPYNAGGDGDNVWPFVDRDNKLHYDCSKLDQWQMVFDHATNLGLHLHFKLQEHEIDDNRRGPEVAAGLVPESLDGGRLGIERKLYCREMIARFGHELGLLWNIGEENTQSAKEQRDMIAYLHAVDPYGHNIVIHTFPDRQDKIYTELLGNQSLLTGTSLQNNWSAAHQRTLKWVRESDQAGRPWVVCNDEQNPASLGVPPDPGYEGFDGIARVQAKSPAKAPAAPARGPDETRGYTLHDIRKLCLWGTLTAGGAGAEYYFGYQLPQNDLVCEDFRSRDRSWDYCRIALDFFRDQKIPFQRMACHDELVGNDQHTNSRYCFAKPGEIYVVYLPGGGTTELDVSEAKERRLTVKWFNPRAGGPLLDGSVKQITGPGKASLGQPPADSNEDWVVLVR